MVTPLGTGIIQRFDYVYSFLFVALLTYIALGRIKALEKNTFVKALAGVIVGIITLTSTIAVQSINRMLPWFILIFVIIIFGLITYQLFGIKEETITEILTTKEHGRTFHNWLLTIIIAIAAISLVITIQEQPAPEIPLPEASTGILTTLATPEIFGVVLILLTGLFAIFYLTSAES